MYAIKTNKAALLALSQGEFYQAQLLFRKNVMKNLSAMTLNNLGSFYIFEGIYTNKDSCRRANKLGISYLQKAIAHQPLSLSFIALGHACFELQEFEGAVSNFGKAYELNVNHATLYNLAMSFYRIGAYDNAMLWFNKAINLCEKPNSFFTDPDSFYEQSEYFDTHTSYLFSLLQIDKIRCHKEIRVLFENDSRDLYLDRFILAYLCDDLPLAESQIKMVLEYWKTDIPVTAMIFDCLIELGNNDVAQNYLNNAIESYEDMKYNVKAEVTKLKKMFAQADYRRSIISTFQFTKPLIAQCCYYGCELHQHSVICPS